MKETKQCSVCTKTKSINEFYDKKRSRVDSKGFTYTWVGKYASCKKCVDGVNNKSRSKYDAYYKEYRENNKENIRARTKDWYIKTNQEWVDLIATRKTLECTKCGYNKTWAGLDFHHLDPREKENSIHSIMKSGKPTEERWTLMKKELDKCIILCATCHREEHMKYNWL